MFGHFRIVFNGERFLQGVKRVAIEDVINTLNMMVVGYSTEVKSGDYLLYFTKNCILLADDRL